jgi:hypothetical protein
VDLGAPHPGEERPIVARYLHLGVAGVVTAADRLGVRRDLGVGLARSAEAWDAVKQSEAGK